MTVSDARSRHRLVWRVATFRDREYQVRVWVRGEMPRDNYYDDIDDAINDFFDALERPEGAEPEDDIGVIFVNAEEAIAVDRLAAALDAAMSALSRQATAAELLACPEWSAVLTAAETAGRAMGIPVDTDLLR